MMTKILAFVVAALLAGCATPMPPAPVYVGAPEQLDQAATIVFYRTTNVFGSGVRPDIAIDGKFVGHSATGWTFRALVAPGKHWIAVDNSTGSDKTRLKIEARARETLYVRTWMGPGALLGFPSIEEVDPEDALAAIKPLKVAY